MGLQSLFMLTKGGSKGFYPPGGFTGFTRGGVVTLTGGPLNGPVLLPRLEQDLINCRECGQTLTPGALAYIDARTAAARARRDEETRRDVEAFLATYPTAHTAPIQELHDAARRHADDVLGSLTLDGELDFADAVIKHVGRDSDWSAYLDQFFEAA